MAEAPAVSRLGLLCALLLLYAVFFWAGRVSGTPAWAHRCSCTEDARTLSITEGLTGADTKGIAKCVLRSQPARRYLDSRLARCLDHSTFHVAMRSTQRTDTDVTSRSWDEFSASDAAASASTADADTVDAAAVDAAAADEGEAQLQPVGNEVAASNDGSAPVPQTDSLSPDERAAKMMAALREQFEDTPEDAPRMTSDAAAEPLPAVATPPAARAERVLSGAEAVADAAAADAAGTASGTAAADAAGTAFGTAAATDAAPGSGSALARPKRVITYSLYGATPKYVNGALRNAELISTIFPGWTARFYIDLTTVPPPIVRSLRSHPEVELVPIDMSKHGSQSMFWRFWAAADSTVERFISRDVDSRLMPRDKVAVDKWIASGQKFHVIRDHPSHSLYPMSGGLWGAVRGALPQVMDLISSFPTDSNYLTDMVFLNQVGVLPISPPSLIRAAHISHISSDPPPSDPPFHDPPLHGLPRHSHTLPETAVLHQLVWPLALHDTLQHDAFSCVEFDNADPYPVGVDRPRGNHVGQVFEADGTARQNDVDALLSAAQPEACRPDGHPEAVRRARGPAPPPREQECATMRARHGVVVGKTWGTLTPEMQLRWQRIACDGLVAAAAARLR